MENVCPMCGEMNETVTHALLTCQEVHNMWKISPLRLEVGRQDAQTFMDWVIGARMQVTHTEWWELFWSLLWGVWLRRNAWVFEKKRVATMDVIHKAVAVVDEYIRANEEPYVIFRDEQAGGEVWRAPEVGSYKINSDAAMFELGKVGLGGVMRDHVGEVVAATCMVTNGSMEVEVAEALAARHAVHIAIDSGLTNIILESDNMKLIKHLKASIWENTSFGNVVADILWLGSLCNSIRYNHVRRKGNYVAHCLAKASKEYGSMRVWLEEVPEEIASGVMNDMLYMNE